VQSNSARFRATAFLIVAFGVLLAQFQIAQAVSKNSGGRAAAAAAGGKALGHLKQAAAAIAPTSVTLPVGAPPTTIPVPAKRASLRSAAPAPKKPNSKKNSNTLGQAGQAGSITIKKDAVPDATDSFHFSGDLGPFDLEDEVALSFSDLEPGVYQVTEAKTEGWQVDHIVCGDPLAGASIVDRGRTVTITLPPRGDTTCTFVNTRAETSGGGGDDTKGDKERNPFKGNNGPKVKPLPLTGSLAPDWFLFSAGMFLIAGGILLRMEQTELFATP
jgi:hypothetical protein